MNKILTFLLLFISVLEIHSQDYIFYALSTNVTNVEPLYRCTLNSESGEISVLERYSGVVTGNYFALSPDNKSLLVTSRNQARNQGGLVQYNVSPEGILTYITSRLKPGGVPSHVTFTPNKEYVMSANYGDDEISLYRFSNNELSPEIHNIVKPDLSKGHYISTDPSGKFVHAVFLGLDKILNYKIESDKFVENSDQPYFSLPDGFGPRHMVFHQEKDFVYILNELHSSVTACSYNSETGAITEIQNISMLPSGFTGTNTAAAIRIHPTGKFLYASNRGHNSIAVYAIAADGKLTLVEHETASINVPRDFNLSPDGKFMIIANLNGNSIMSLRINENTGSLTNTGQIITIANPLAIEFLPAYINTSAFPVEKNLKEKDLFNFYPNPADCSITLCMNQTSKSMNFTLYNATGGIVRSLYPDITGETDIRGLPEGLYFVKGCSNDTKGKNLTKPLLIIRN